MPTSSRATSNSGHRGAASGAPGPGPGPVASMRGWRASACRRATSPRSSKALLDEQPASACPALDIVVDDFELRGRKLRPRRDRGREPDPPRAGPRGGARVAPREDERHRARGAADGNRHLGRRGQRARRPGAEAPRVDGLQARAGRQRRAARAARRRQGDARRQGRAVRAGVVARLAARRPTSRAWTGRSTSTIDAGQFLKAEPGAARLLSVLSLQSLPRRLRSTSATCSRRASRSTTSPATSRSTTAWRAPTTCACAACRPRADGRSAPTSARETQDLRVVVVPEINAGTASLAYAAINPAIGLGTFLAQNFLRKPLIAGRHARVPRHRRRGPTRRSSGSSAAGSKTCRRPNRRRLPRRRPTSEPPHEDRRPADGVDARGRAQPRRAPPADRAKRRAAGRSWSRCPSTSASWAARPRQAGARRGARQRSDPAARWPTPRARTACGLIGGTLPIQSRRHRSACATRCCVYAPDGTLAARYDKIHLFRYDNGRERYDEGARAAGRRDADGVRGRRRCASA